MKRKLWEERGAGDLLVPQQGPRDPGEKLFKLHHHAVTHSSTATARVESQDTGVSFLLCHCCMLFLPHETHFLSLPLLRSSPDYSLFTTGIRKQHPPRAVTSSTQTSATHHPLHMAATSPQRHLVAIPWLTSTLMLLQFW